MQGWPKLLGLGGVILLAAVGLAVACGGGDGGQAAETPEDYARSFCEVFEKHGEALTSFVETDWDEIGDDIEAGRRVLSDASTVLGDLAKDLDRIDPPDEIEQQHQDMVSAFADGAEILRQVNEVFDKPLEEASQDIEELTPRVDEVATAFDRIGDLPPEYEDAFDTEPKCQEVLQLFEGF